MKRPLLIATVLALTGCGSVGVMQSADCAGADWLRYGLRDGAESGRSSLDAYRAACGTSVNEAQYAQGLEEGRRDRSLRRF